MRRLERGVLDKILNKFLCSHSRYGIIEVNGVDPVYLKKQLARKIKHRELYNIRIVGIFGNELLLKHLERNMMHRVGSDLIFHGIPKIKL